ncbi:MAG: recombinase family protein [Candidatus Levybacteria bacterium]|nr:recombinase family protein [Candidatus Levybacteria bacterium]
MLIAIYARVSSERQEKEETIQTQIMALEDFAKEKGHTIVARYLDDGWSGTILARPSLDDLRLDARKKLWEGVLIYDPDRLARKYSYQELVSDELIELGLKVLYVTIAPPEDDSDKLLYGVKGLFAEYERARIAERFRLGKLRKARDGNVVTSQAPYGYDYIPKQGSTQGYYKINKQETAVVKMIFQWIAVERITLRETVRRLLELGIAPRKSKRGVWNTSTLTNLLRNETYIGTAHFNKSIAIIPEKPLKNIKYKRVKKTSRRFKPEKDWISIPVPPILDEAIYQKARQQLKANYELCARNKKNDYLLAGKIYCTCGRRRTGEGPQKGKHLYYRCTDRIYCFPLPPKCRERGVNARIADVMVWQGISDLMSDPKLLKEQAMRFTGNKTTEVANTSTEADELKREIEKLKKEEGRYIKAYGAEIISEEQFKEAINDLKGRRGILERQVGHMESQKQDVDDVIVPTDNYLEEFSDAARFVLKERLKFPQKQAIIHKSVDTIIGEQCKLTIRGYIQMKEVFDNVKFRNSWSSKHWKIYVI